MRVVVTGGAGFIGANLVRDLVAQPWVDDVVVVDDLSTGSAENLREVEVRTVVGTVLDSGLLDGALRGADAVVHLAAIPSVPRSLADPVATHLANATGTLAVLEAARRAEVDHLVVASSSSVYGANPTLPKHEGLRPEPLSPYAASKLATETYSLAYQSCFGLGVLAFRFFNVYGPLQAPDHAYAAVVPAFVSAAVRGRPLVVHGDGLQTRDFTYVGTVSSVIAEAVRARTTSPGPVNLAFGTRTSLRTLIDIVQDVTGATLEIVHAPDRPGDVRDSQADNSRLVSLFPEVRAVPFRDGLQDTVEWMRRRGG